MGASVAWVADSRWRVGAVLVHHASIGLAFWNGAAARAVRAGDDEQNLGRAIDVELTASLAGKGSLSMGCE